MSLSKKAKQVSVAVGFASICGLVYLGIMSVNWPSIFNQCAPNQTVHSEEHTAKKRSTDSSQTKFKPSNQFRDNGNRPIYVQSALTNQLNQDLKYRGFKGTALVVQNGHIIFNQAYGNRNQSGDKNEVTTVYPLASITKNITGVLLMKELAKSQYSLETLVSVFYPNLPRADATTLKDLVNMTSGYTVKGFSKKDLSETGYIDDVVRRVKANPQTGHWRYSAANYIIISGILRKLSHKSYDELLAEYIQPYYHVEDNAAFLSDAHRAIGYKLDGKTPVKAPKSAFYSEVGTGDTYASPYTYYKLLNDEIHGKLISTVQFTGLTQPTFGEHYGGGLYTSNNAYFGHGTQVGFEPTYRLSKDGKTGIFLFSNQQTKQQHKSLVLKYFSRLMWQK